MKIEEPHATALRWIVGILRDAEVPFQITGGLGARFHGAHRPLVDIDLDVPRTALSPLAEILASHVVFGPATYRDRHWELDLLTVVYDQVTIDLGACDARLFSALTHAWISVNANLDASVQFEVDEMRVPVVDRSALVSYKRQLDREVDRLDIAAIDRGHSVIVDAGETS